MNDEWKKFLDDAVSHIRDKKIRSETREELLDHLEDRKERFMRFGDSAEEAERKSLELMGDRVVISEQLGKLHSFAYVDQLSRAMLIMFFGVLFSLFNINIGDVAVLSPIGSVLIFIGSYMLRDCNSLLKKAWYVSIVKIFWSAFCYSIKAVPFFARPQSEWITYSVIIAGIIISAVHYAFLLSGIGEIADSAADNTNFVAPKMKRAIIAYIIANTATLLGAITENTRLVIPVLIISFLCFAYIVLSVLRAYIIIKKTEYRTDRIDKFGKKGVAVISAALALVIISVGITCYISSTPKVKSEICTDVHTEEVNKIRKELIENGFPKDAAKWLPDEEIMKCYPLDKEYPIRRSDDMTERNLHWPNIISVPIIDRETGERSARYIYTFKYGYNTKISGYRDSIMTIHKCSPIPGSDSYGILYEKGDGIHKQEPLRIHYNSCGLVDGLEYRTVKDAYRIFGYIAVTGIPMEESHSYNMVIELSEKYPLNYPYFSALDTVNEADGSMGNYNPRFLANFSLQPVRNDMLCFNDYAMINPEDWQRKLWDKQYIESSTQENVFGNYIFQ